MIRLDAILITGLPQVSKTDVPEPYGVRVNCVLYSGHLSDHQELEVLVNGVLQMGVREGDQSVFTWQFFQASDEVRITLLSRGMKMKYWQGCWNERDTILHAGTLPVQVFFNGKPQPILETLRTPISSAAPSSVSSALAETVNGNGHTETIVLERDQDENQSEEGDEAAKRTVIVQDLLVIAASGYAPDVQSERDAALKVDLQEEKERELIEFEGDDNTTQWEEEGVTTARKEMESSNETQQVDYVGIREAIAPQSEIHDLVGGDEQQQSAHMAGRSIVAFHASSLEQQKMLQSLRDLVATMSPKTLIVDVRPKDRRKKKYQEQDGLSRRLLRSVFGAKYWDRVWAIQIVSQMIPRSDRVGFATWRYVVDNPESYPDGIPSLVKKLEEGYSIVVMDSIAKYAESRRKAVIDELQQRVPTLNVRTLG